MEDKLPASFTLPLPGPLFALCFSRPVSLRASSRRKIAACWFYPLAGKAFHYQPEAGPGWRLLAPSASVNSEKADGVMVTGVLEVSF